VSLKSNEEEQKKPIKSLDFNAGGGEQEAGLF